LKKTIFSKLAKGLYWKTTSGEISADFRWISPADRE